MFKKIIQWRLEQAVKKYLKKNPAIKLVVVTGSVGKTSTKVAIGTVLNQKLRVRLHEGNHNSELSAPLAILGVEFPTNIRSFGQWRQVFKAVKQRLNQPADVDVIVQELGTDRIGQVPHFGKYLKPDIAVVTAVSPEHMEYFGTLDAVAAEELAAANFSKFALINRDDIDATYATDLTSGSFQTYGTTESAEYRFVIEDYDHQAGFNGLFVTPDGNKPVTAALRVVGEHSLRAAVAAGAVAHKLGLDDASIAVGLGAIRPVDGRMNLLRGINGSTVIDDTYNSSPLAVESALRALYQMNAPQKIAVLGSMNELGAVSPEEHTKVGSLCDPSQLTHVITVGEDAAKYLAPAARQNGCHVVSFRNPLHAGAAVNRYVEPGTVILFKGSQGGIFLEEAVKVVLHSADDAAKLVRQSPAWLTQKQSLLELSD